jgi:hypothetical protein
MMAYVGPGKDSELEATWHLKGRSSGSQNVSIMSFGIAQGKRSQEGEGRRKLTSRTSLSGRAIATGRAIVTTSVAAREPKHNASAC